MVKKITLTLFVAIASMISQYAVAQNFSFNWAHSVDGRTTGGDNVIGGAVNTEGDYFVAMEVGTSRDSVYQNIFDGSIYRMYIDGQAIKDINGKDVEGGQYYGTSLNKNLVLSKVGKDGKIKWSAYSTKGDLESNITKIVATKDGGLIILLKVRAWVEGDGLDVLFEYTDPKGVTTTVKDANTQKAEYRDLIVKLNIDGEIQWYREIYGEVWSEATDEHPKIKYATKNNAYLYGLALDENENIYLAGNFRTSLTFPKADGTTATIKAISSSQWNGDSQDATGDMFIAKLDNKGYYEKSIMNEGTVDCAFIDNLIYYNGKICFNGRVAGGSNITLGGKAIDSSSFQTMIFGSVNTSDLSVNYITRLISVANSKNRFVLQNKRGQLMDGSIYFTGLLNGGWKKTADDAADLVNTNDTNLKGYLLKLNPENGEVQNVTLQTLDYISGYYGAFLGKEYVYAFGYQLSTSTGALLTAFDKNTFEKKAEYTLCSFGLVAVCAEPIINGNDVLFMNRGGVARTYTNTASFYGTDTKLKNLACWGMVFYSYNFTDLAGINDVVTDVKDYNNYDVYTITGVLLKKASSMEEAVNGLDRGLYIIGHKKVAIQ